MGYELHLVKKGEWFDEENKFAESEWQNLQSKQSIPDWVYFSGGDIAVKNPTKSQIIALAKIAKVNGWLVQGDDGETYSEDGTPTPAAVQKSDLFEPIRKLIREFKARREISQMMKGVECPFKIGDQVRALGAAQSGTVIEIDTKANHGIGSFTVKLQNGTIDKTFGYEAHTYKREQ